MCQIGSDFQLWQVLFQKGQLVSQYGKTIHETEYAFSVCVIVLSGFISEFYPFSL